MKAFVIKNKDGYYLVNTFAWSKKLIHTYIDESEKDLEIVLKKCKDCTIVPITICEGDLEEENEFLKNFAYQLFRDMATRESKGGLTEATIKKDFEDVLKNYKNYLQQAKESEKDERN